MLTLSGVGKTYGEGPDAVTALSDVNLHVERGEFVAVTGRSGSGKSTLLAVLGCLDGISRGRIEFDGEDISRLGRDPLADLRNRKIGFVFQSFHLMGRLSALANVAMPLVYRGVAACERHRLAHLALERVGLAHRAHHLPAQLSGGQRQRVAIARALAGSPLLLLADEPTGNLDSTTAREIMGLFEDVHRAGMTVVLVTHDDAHAALASRRLHVEDGRVLHETTPPSAPARVLASVHRPPWRPSTSMSTSP